MPAGNVTVTPENFKQAEFTAGGAPAAVEGVLAKTGAPLVTGGTVANIGTSDVKQGKVMYYAKQKSGETVPTAPTYESAWSENVPNSNDFTEGDVYVWYYIAGAEPASVADRSDANTCSDSDIKAINASGFVAVGPEPTYVVSLNKTGLATGEPANWKAKSETVTTEVNLGTNDLEGVTKGETVTVTYTGSRKVIGLKAEKKPAAPTSYTIVAGNDIKSTNVTTFPFQFTHLNQNTMYGMTAEVVGGDGKVSATVNVMNGCVNITVTGAFDTDAIVYVMEQGKTKEDATWSFPVICKVNK